MTNDIPNYTAVSCKTTATTTTPTPPISIAKPLSTGLYMQMIRYGFRICCWTSELVDFTCATYKSETCKVMNMLFAFSAPAYTCTYPCASVVCCWTVASLFFLALRMPYTVAWPLRLMNILFLIKWTDNAQCRSAYPDLSTPTTKRTKVGSPFVLTYVMWLYVWVCVCFFYCCIKWFCFLCKPTAKPEIWKTGGN